MKQKYALIGTLAVSLMIAGTASANIASGMNAMWNSTSASSGGVNGNIGGTLGGFSARVPQRTYHFVAYDAPRFQAGCGGIDLHFGSFSMMSGENITALMRGIIANAGGYAFKQALDAVCPSCNSIMSSFQDQLQKISSANVNTCKAASLMVDSIAGDSQKRGEAKQQVSNYWEGLKSTMSGKSKDNAASQDNLTKNGDGANRDANASKDSTAYGNSFVNAAITTKLISGDAASSHLDYTMFGSPKNAAGIYMSLIGTNIAKDKPREGAGDKNEVNADKSYNALWSFKDFVQGNRSKTTPLAQYACKTFNVSDASTCQEMSTETSDWKGMKRYVIKMLAGNQGTDDDKVVKVEDSSIMAAILDNGKAVNLTEEQRAFMKRIPSNLMESMNRAARCGDNTALQVTETVAEHLANQMGAEFITEFGRQVRSAHAQAQAKGASGKAKEIVPLTAIQLDTLSRLEKDAEAYIGSESQLRFQKLLSDSVCLTSVAKK